MSTRTHYPLACPFILAALLVGVVGSSAGQRFRPVLTGDELAAGAAGNAILRGPWLTAPWRRPLPRLAVFTVGSLVYERFVDTNGWSWSDFNQRMMSYALTEAVIGGVRWLRHRRASRRPGGPWLLATPHSCAAGSYLRMPLPPAPSILASTDRLCELQRRR